MLMRYLSTVGFVVASVLALTACGDTARPPATAAPRADITGPLAVSCNFTTLKQNARSYSASNKDPLFTIIGDLQSLSKNGPNAAATDKAFDGLSRLAAMRGTSAQSSGATGAVFNALTTGFLGCMESYITATIPGDFTVAGALGPGWLYEVRGKDASDGSLGAYERGNTPDWAAEAPAGWGASISAAAQAKRFLIYGSRITDFLTNDPEVGSSFELRTIPTIASGVLAFSSPLTIGVCNLDVTPTLRVQHINAILPLQPLACSAPPAFAAASTRSSRFLASLARHAANLVTPNTAQAAFKLGAVGGGASELSPSVVIDMQRVTLAFVKPIANGRNSSPLADANGNPIQVAVTTLNGTPLPNVVVTLSIVGNSSSIAFFRDGTSAPSVTVTRTTGADGLATFAGVSLTKAGGYQLSTSGSFDGVAGAPVASNSFNIQNK